MKSCLRKRSLALKNTKLMSSTHVPGDIHKELDDAAKSRALSNDECSDAETELFRFVAHSKCADADLGSKRQRKFFFKFIEGVMSAIRRLESNQLNNPDHTGGNGNGKNKHNLPSTLNFNTNTQGQACIMNNCGKEHKNSKGKSSKSLQFCDHFCKNLKLHERNRVIKVAKIAASKDKRALSLSTMDTHRPGQMVEELTKTMLTVTKRKQRRMLAKGTKCKNNPACKNRSGQSSSTS